MKRVYMRGPSVTIWNTIETIPESTVYLDKLKLVGMKKTYTTLPTLIVGYKYNDSGSPHITSYSKLERSILWSIIYNRESRLLTLGLRDVKEMKRMVEHLFLRQTGVRNESSVEKCPLAFFR